jgi:hypothetical protein
MVPPKPVAAVPEFDSKRLLRLYTDGNHEQLSGEILTTLQHYAATTYVTLDPLGRARLYEMLKTILHLFTQQDFLIPEKHVAPFIAQNHLLSNLVAMTPLGTTDFYLEMLRLQQANFVKILTLYSGRNTIRFDRGTFFAANPQLAALWYNCFCSIYKNGLANDNVVRHLAEHLAHQDERMPLAPELQEPYFACSYLNGETDRDIKPFLNQVVRRSIKPPPPGPRANPKRIAVISDTWHPQHSVYRNYAAYVRELKKSYHLTYFHILRKREEMDVGMFDEAYHLETRDGALNIDPLVRGEFTAIYYPDIGMSLPSILLANHRLAPLQICSPGHSVSTWGADIDYFISGQDTEVPEQPQRNYSERLVLLPGMGVVHNRPLYEPTGRTKSVPELIINCPWSGQKIHLRFCQTLRKLIDRSERPLRLRFTAGSGLGQNGFIPFQADVRAALGTRAALDVLPALPYKEYMTLMEEGDLALDSFHFSGCNSVADSLFLHKPTVVWEGDKWYNRIGPSMLRLVGQDDAICHNEEEYLATALRLIHNDQERERISAKLRATDLSATVFSTVHAPAFVRAVEYLIANHPRLQRQGSREPIVIH